MFSVSFTGPWILNDTSFNLAAARACLSADGRGAGWVRTERMKLLTVTLSAVFLLAGCQTALQAESSPRATTGEQLWVAARVVGGKQCELPRYTPPDTRQLLEQAGVTVFETAVEHLAVCSACGCPDYAAIHRALINQADLDKALQLGFKPGHAPPALS